MPRRISEVTRSLAEASTPAEGDGRFLIQLISPGWGSSGYYAAEMIQRDGPAVFPAGTHCYLDHAGAFEDQDHQGVRSVRDLAAVLTEDAHWDDAAQALVAEVRVTAAYREMLGDLKDDVGLSIVALAEGKAGEAEGRSGLLIVEMFPSALNSVDFVTHAGRGGRVLAVLESARHEHTREAYGFTANDLRSLLSDAVSAAFGGQDVWLYVLDYSDTGIGDWLVFNRDSSDADGTFQVAYSVTDGAVTFAGDPVEVYVHTQYLPVGTTPPAQSVPIPTQEASTMPEIDEAELRQLRETATNAQAAEQRAVEAERRATEAETRAQMLTAAGVARGRIDTALAEGAAAQLPAAVHDRIRERVIRDLPLTEAGVLDTAAFDTRVTEAVTAEREFVATLAEQMGAGRPRGVGGGSGPADATALTEAQTQLTDAFKGLGMSDDAAALAARGRK